METELENQVLVKELEKHGLVKNGEITLDESDIIALKRGNMTDPVELKNIKGEDGFEIDTVRARLSVVNDGGRIRLRKDPVYKKVQNHPLLTESDKIKLLTAEVANIKKTSSFTGIILNFGKANYLFKEKEKPSFFIELSKYDGTTKTIWGVDLERALNDSSFKKGDRVQLNNLGSKKVQVDVAIKDEKGKTTSLKTTVDDRNTWEVVEPRIIAQDQVGDEISHVIEYDPRTNQFIDYDPKKLKIPEQINGETLSTDKKRQLKEGEVITLADGTQAQIRTVDRNGLRSNRGVLVLSILVDGGLSYLLVTGISRLFGSSKSPEYKAYSKGYIEALREVEKQLERKQQRFPKDASIANEINVVKQELNNASNMSHDQLNDLSKKDADDIKSGKSVGDPDHGKDTFVVKNLEVEEEELLDRLEGEHFDIDKYEEQHYKKGFDGGDRHKRYHMENKLEGDDEHVEQSRSRSR